MRKIEEHTYGPHIHMKLELDNGRIEEIDVYLRDDGEHYKVSSPEIEDEIIAAFHALY